VRRISAAIDHVALAFPQSPGPNLTGPIPGRRQIGLARHPPICRASAAARSDAARDRVQEISGAGRPDEPGAEGEAQQPSPENGRPDGKSPEC